MQQFEYNRSGGFAATTHYDGSRSFLHVVEPKHRALLIHPQGMALLELDDRDQLRKIRRSDGHYRMIDYYPSGRLKRVASFSETFSLFWNGEGILSAVHSDCGLLCELKYNTIGQLDGLVTEAGRGTRLDDVRRLLRFIWQCLGLRTIHTLATV
jgi:hypothetical protein